MNFEFSFDSRKIAPFPRVALIATVCVATHGDNLSRPE